MNTQFKAARAENYRVSDRSAADIRYLVIHFTANDGDTAKKQRGLLRKGSAGRVRALFVDEKEIWQSVREKGHRVALRYERNVFPSVLPQCEQSRHRALQPETGRKVLFCA